MIPVLLAIQLTEDKFLVYEYDDEGQNPRLIDVVDLMLLRSLYPAITVMNVESAPREVKTR